MTDTSPTTRWFDLPHAPAAGTVVAQMDTLVDECATMITVGGTDTHGFRMLLLRSGPSVHAFVNRCPHFGVPLAGRQEQLLQKPGASLTCNVHYARFRWSDGFCESGDCMGESLIPVPLTLHGNGRICIADNTADRLQGNG